MPLEPRELSAMMGWCLTGHHAGTADDEDSTECEGETWVGDDYLICSCPCHAKD